MSRILVVEDEPAIAIGLKDDLEVEGYEVDVAEDGVVAMEAAVAWSPDSKSFLLRKHLTETRVELWRVSSEGNSPQRINERLEGPLATGGVRVHADGRRILLVPPERGPIRSQSQIMLLEDFLPSRNAQKTAAR